MNKILHFIKENFLACILGGASIAYIICVSLFYDVGLTPDSTNYLREARVLLAGKGFQYIVLK